MLLITLGNDERNYESISFRPHSNPRDMNLAFFLCFLAVSAACPKNPSSYNFKHGEIFGTIVSDGPIILEDNFFLVPEIAVKRAYDACFRSSTPVVWAQNSVVLDTWAGRLLVDAGAFNLPTFIRFRKAGKLLQNMRAAGIEPETIDAVLLTHGHPDHVAGLTDENGKAVFPNAKVYVGLIEHEFWTSEPIPNPNPDIPNATIAEFGDIYRRNIRPYPIVTVPDRTSPLPGVKFILSKGHTPGHTSIEIKSKRDRLVIVGDAWFSKPDQVRNPEWTFLFETNGLDGVKSRLRLLDRLARRRDLVLAYHEDFPGLGYITPAAASFDWIPAPPQLLGNGVEVVC